MKPINSFNNIIHEIQSKKILFVTTKNLSYIRNTQEINIIKGTASSYSIIGSDNNNYFIRLLVVYSKLLFTSIKPYQYVWIGFAPQLILPLFKHKLKIANKKIIVDFFISLFDTFCYDRKKLKSNSLLGKLLHYIDKVTLFHADMIICDTNTHGQFFIDEFGALPHKIYTLYLQADSSLYYPMRVHRPNFLNGKFVVLYFGSILPLQGADIVLHAIDILKEQRGIYFYFIGPIKDKKLASCKPTSNNITYIDWLSQEELAIYINYADLCLAGHFNASIEKAKRTIPGKAYIYNAVGKDIILGDNPANHELLTNSNNIHFVEMGNAKALANTILHLYEKHNSA